MKTITHLELSKKYAGNLPMWQHKKNAEFFKQVHETLKNDGIYMYPGARAMFKKSGSGWVLYQQF